MGGTGNNYMAKVVQYTDMGYAVFGHCTGHYIAFVSAGQGRVYILDPARYPFPSKEGEAWKSYSADEAAAAYHSRNTWKKDYIWIFYSVK